MMVVHVEQIRDDGLKLDEPLEQTFLAQALEERGPQGDYHARGGTALKATLQKVGGGVLLEGALTVPVAAPCSRCLTDVTLDVPVRFVLNLVARPSAPPSEDADDDTEGEGGADGESEGSFELDRADEEFFDGRRIDLAPIVKEQVLLALPMKVVCRDDCKGLCPQCGQDMNVKVCQCDRHVPDPRLAALKNIKLS